VSLAPRPAWDRDVAVIVEICQKFYPSRPAFQGHWRSLKPTGIGRSPVGCVFLLVFHSNCESISYRFRDNGQYLHNICKHFPITVHLTPLLTGLPLEFCNGVKAKKTKMMTISDSQKMKMWRCLLTQYRNWAEWQTNGRSW